MALTVSDFVAELVKRFRAIVGDPFDEELSSGEPVSEFIETGIGQSFGQTLEVWINGGLSQDGVTTLPGLPSMPEGAAKGDLAVYDGSDWQVLPVGTDGYGLTANSGASLGVDWQAGSGGGEANTASNVGGGVEVFKQKSSVDLELRTLTPGIGITLTENADTVEIAGGNYTDKTYSQVAALSPVVGEAAWPTDASGYTAVCRTAGTWSWLYRGQPVVPPPTTGWSWVNQGSATVSTIAAKLVLETPPSASLAQRIRVRTMPVGAWVVSVNLESISGYQRTGGLILRDSSSGRIIRFGVSQAQSGTVIDQQGRTGVLYDNGPTSNSSVPSQFRAPHPDFKWFQIEDDTTDFIFRASHDGETWVEIATHGRTAWLASPDEVGIHVASTTVDGVLIVRSWREA
ncbi:MAG: hypothetical protein ACPGVG_16885 [Mycobacterium sp.]